MAAAAGEGTDISWRGFAGAVVESAVDEDLITICAINAAAAAGLDPQALLRTDQAKTVRASLGKVAKVFAAAQISGAAEEVYELGGEVTARTAPLTWSLTCTGGGPTVAVEPVSAPAGTPLSQPGTGFTPDGAVTLHFGYPDGHVVTTIQRADESGGYLHFYPGDGLPAGTYDYWATDETTGQDSDTVQFEIEAAADVSVSPASGRTGASYTASASGCTVGGTVRFTWTGPDGAVATAETTAGAAGTADNARTLATRGTWTVAITDVASDSTATAYTAVDLSPALSVSPASGAATATFTQGGTGFTPNGSVTLLFAYPDGTTHRLTVETDTNGAFTQSYQPSAYTAPGEYWFMGFDGPTSYASAEKGFVIEATPTVSVAPASASRGAILSEPGQWFTPGGTATLHFWYPDGTQHTLTKTVASNGTFTNDFRTTASLDSGTYQYWAVDDATGEESNRVAFTLY